MEHFTVAFLVSFLLLAVGGPSAEGAEPATLDASPRSAVGHSSVALLNEIAAAFKIVSLR